MSGGRQNREAGVLSRHRRRIWWCCGSRFGIAGSWCWPSSAAWPRCPRCSGWSAQELHPRRGLVGVPTEHSGPGRNVAGGHAGDDRPDRPRHPHNSTACTTPSASVADTEQRNPYQGTIYVRLVNIADREYGQLEMMDFVRKNILPKYDGRTTCGSASLRCRSCRAAA